MIFPLIIAIFLAVLSIVVAIRLKESRSLNGLLALAYSVLVLSMLQLITSDPLILIVLLTCATIAAWFQKNESLTLRALLIAAIGVLSATYFYGGSQRAAIFPITLLAIGCAATLISIFIATHYSWKKPLHMFNVASVAFFILAAASAAWIIPFRPLLILGCVAVGLACAHLCVRVSGTWARIAITIVALIGGYWIVEVYGIIIVFVSFSALLGNTTLLPSSREHIKIIDDFLLITLFLLVIRSIASAGRSILFEVNDPFLLAGILLSILFVWGYRAGAPWLYISARRAWLVLLAPIIFSASCILIFGKIHGLIVLVGALMGLILRTLISPETREDLPPAYRTLVILFILTTFLFVRAL